MCKYIINSKSSSGFHWVSTIVFQRVFSRCRHWLSPQYTTRCNWRWQSVSHTAWEVWKVSVSLKTANKCASTHAKAIKEATYQAYLSKYDALNKDALHNCASTHTRKPLFVYFEAVEKEKEGKKKHSWHYFSRGTFLPLCSPCHLLHRVDCTSAKMKLSFRFARGRQNFKNMAKREEDPVRGMWRNKARHYCIFFQS